MIKIALPAIMMNIVTWIIVSVIAIILNFVLFLILILMKMFTHGFQELKAKVSGKPIAMFFEDTKYVSWKPIKAEAGMICDKEFGHFLISENGSYIDRQTKNIYLPFDVNLGSGASVKTFKMADDLWKVFQDEKQMNKIRQALMTGQLDKTELEGLRESINFSHLRSLTNTILPHNITAKIEKTIASRLSGFRNVNAGQAVMYFLAIFGAIIMGGILIKSMGK